MKFKLLFVLIFCLFQSCNKNEIYSAFDRDFQENHWTITDERVFEYLNTNSDTLVSLKLHFGHIYGYQFASIPLEVAITSPDGSTEIIPVDLQIKDASGKELGDCSGDICDVYFQIKPNYKLDKGKYSFRIKNNFNGEYLPNVLGIGISIEGQSQKE